MWLARKTSAERAGALNAMTAQSGEQGIVGECGCQAAAVCAPYGIYTKPPEREELLLLSVNGNKVCLGTVQEQQPELKAGEILLQSAGGASIRLCADGRILLNGRAFE